MVRVSQLVELVQSKPIVALLALVTHYVLHSGEWDNAFHIFLGIWAVTFSGIAAAEYLYDERANPIGAVVQVLTTTAGIYFGILITSVLIYRGFFHRLGRVSGSGSELVNIDNSQCTDPRPIPGTILEILRYFRRRIARLPVLQVDGGITRAV